MQPPRGTALSWAVRTAGDVRWVACSALERVPGLVHGFSTDPDAAGRSFDQGGWPFEDAAAAGNRRRLAAAIGAPGAEARHLRQVHGALCRSVEEVPDAETAAADGERAAAYPEADGWLADRAPDRLVAVRTADCVPLLLADRRGRRAAAVHAGWRGTAARIAPAAVGGLVARGQDPAELIAALGPAISGPRYEVGEEVLGAVAASVGAADPREVACPRPGEERPGIDLRRWLVRQLVAAGVPRAQVHVAPWCTFERAELFASWRRQGKAAGRMAAAIGWPAEGPFPPGRTGPP